MCVSGYSKSLEMLPLNFYLLLAFCSLDIATYFSVEDYPV